MLSSLVLTIIGADRPGLVEAVARVVAGHGGNWLSSRMAHLAGQFAGIVHVEVPTDQVDDLQRGLKGLEARGLAVMVQRGEVHTPPTRPVKLELIGHDRPGIVRDLSHLLSRHGVNVEELETSVESAPMTGESLFKATAAILVPQTLATADLRRELEQLASALMVDIQLRD
jgi:glycine cleavage system regulatory protein